MARFLVVSNTDFFMRIFLRPLVLELGRRGHEVELCCNGDDVGSELSHLPRHSMSFPSKPSPRDFAQTIVRMTGLLRKGRFDVVNSHNRNASIAARVAGAFPGGPAHAYTANGFYFNDAQGWLSYTLSLGLEAALAPVTDVILSQTEEDVRFVTGLKLIRNKRCKVIGNGVDLDRFTQSEPRSVLERRLGLEVGKIRIVAVGRLVHGKGFQDLLEAFARLLAYRPNLELLQVGGNIAQDISPFSDQYSRRLASLGIGHAVQMTGMTTDVPSYLGASDIFVLPSYWEGLSRSLLEAMAMELPVAVSRIRGSREVVEEGVSGSFFDPGDVDQLTYTLRSLVDAGPVGRRRMGRAGRAHVMRHFDERAYTYRQVKALETLASSK